MDNEYIEGLYEYYMTRNTEKGCDIYIVFEHFYGSVIYDTYKPRYDLYLRKEKLKQLRK